MRRGFRLLKGATSVAALALMASAQSAWAQEASEDSAKEDDAFGEIVVTAQKRDQNLNDVGITITAFTGDALNQLGIQDTTDIAAIVPGLTFTDVGFGPPIYNLRGVGFKDTSFNSTSTVGIYVDEAAIAYPIQSLGATLDLERVEVLKGPQGTLYGRNNTGGAINYIAAKPTEELEGRIEASVASFERFDIEGAVSGSIADGLRARLAFATTQSNEGPQRDIVTGETLGEIDKLALRFSVVADISQTTELLVQFSYWNDKSDSVAAQVVASSFQSPGNTPITSILQRSINIYSQTRNSNTLAGFTSGVDLRNNSSNTSVTARLRQEITDSIDFTAITAFSRYRDDNGRRDLAGFSVPFAEAARFVSGYTTIQESPRLANLYIENDATIHTFSQEARLSGNTDRLNWVGGFYFANDTVNSRVNQNVPLTSNTNNFGPLTNPADPASRRFNIASALQDGVSRTRTYGVFGQVEYEITDSLKATFGLRYSNDRNDYVYCARDSDGLFGPLVFGVPAGECFTLLANGTRGQFIGRLSESSVSGRLALDYKVNDDILIYGSLSRGFKAGSFPNILATVAGQVEPAVQEELRSIELGFKATLLDGAVQLNGSGYYYDYKDKQALGVVNDPNFGVLRRLVNIPNSTINGAEVELQVKPLDGLFVSFGGAYVDSSVTGDFIGPNANAVLINYRGSRFQDTAKFQFTGLFNYDFPISGGLDGFVGGDVSYSSRINYDFEPGPVIAGVAANAPTTLDPNFIGNSYAVFGARIGIADDDDKWRLSIWSRNLGNETYPVGIRRVLDSVTRYVGYTRTFGATIEYNF